jgi:hypothetical protein
MKVVLVNKRKLIKILVAYLMILLLVLLLQQYYNYSNATKMIMGGKYYIEVAKADENIMISGQDVEKYFRPSKLPVLNDKFNLRFFDNYSYKNYSEIIVPNTLLKTPEDTIINYFSILREAANSQEGKGAGCGSIGYSTIPYPVAYNFLSSTYQETLSYDQYLKTFENILHLNLIKYREIPVYDNTSDIVRYFVEIETIEGSDKDVAYFAYYYGFVDMIKEGEQYKISDLKFFGEDYLCAPLHGWWHYAEAVVDVKYGYWCSLIEERYPTQQEDYVKNIYFKGTDGYDYLIVFYQLTNDTDIEISQYRKSKEGKWKLIKLDPEKCLENRE